MAYSIGELVATLRLDDQLSGQLAKVGGALQGVGKNLAMAGAGLTTFGAAVGAAMIPAVKAAAEYETAMTKIRALTIASSEDVANWSQQILKLSGEVGKAPKELADALYFVASSGQVGATGFQILEAAAKMAALGMGETEEIARSLVSAVNAYGKENLSAAQAADILTRSVIEGGAQADEYAKVLGRILPIASQLGVGLDEVGAFMATFTRLGVKGSEAATALRGALNALAAPGKQAAEEFEKFNLSGEKLRKMLAEQGLVAVLEHLMKVTGGNVEALDRMIPNIRALTGVLGVAGKQSAEYARILGTVKDSQGQFTKSFGEWSQTAAAQWAQLTASLKAVSVELGTALLPLLKETIPTLKGLASSLSDAAKWFGTLDEGTRKWTGSLILLGGPGLMALGGILALLPSLVAGFKLVSPVVVPATVAVVGFLAAFKATSWLLDSIPLLRRFSDACVDAAMHATGLAQALDLWNKYQERGTVALRDMTSEQRVAFQEFKKSQGDQIALQKIGMAVTTDWNVLAKKTTQTYDGLVAGVKDLGDETDQTSTDTKEWTENLDRLDKALTDFGADMEKQAWERWASELDRLGDALAAAAAAADNKAWEEWDRDLERDERALTAASRATDEAAQSFDGLVGEVRDLTEEEERLRDVKLEALFSGLVTLADLLGGSFGDLAGILNNVGRGFQAIAKEEDESVKSAMRLQLALQTVGQIGASLSQSATPAVQKLGGALQGAAAGAQIGTAILPGWGTAIGAAAGAIAGFVSGAQKMKKEVNDLRDSFIGAHGGWLALQKSIKEATDEDLLKKLFDADTVDEYSAAMREITDILDIWNGSQQALNEAVERYGLTIDELGPRFAAQKLDEMAGQLIQDYRLLEASGADMVAVLEKMAPAVNDYVQQALAAGQAIPEAMRPVIEKMIQQGLLLDANGEAYTSVEDAGITFAQTMSEQFDTLIDKIDAMVEALMRFAGVEIPTVHVPVVVDYPNYDRPPEGERGQGPPEMATGGIVRSPTLALLGERGPEAVVPLSGAGNGATLEDVIAELRSLRTFLPETLTRAVRSAAALTKSAA